MARVVVQPRHLQPEQAGRGRKAIEAAAEEAGREIEDYHYGISLPLALDGIAADTLAAVRERQPDTDPAELVATSWSHARDLVRRYVEAGLTKFVVRPVGPAQYESFLDSFVDQLVPLQN